MDFEFPISDSAGVSTDGHPAVYRETYSRPAPVPEVMFDQLEYLLAHTRGECPPFCRDCERLQQVSNWLLLPFRSARA